MKYFLQAILKSNNFINIGLSGEIKLKGHVLIPAKVSDPENAKRNYPAFHVFNLLGCLIMLTFFSNTLQAQTYLSTGSNTNIITNTTYSGAGIYGGTTTVKTGVTVIFTGGVALSGSAKFIIETGATVIIHSGGFAASGTSTLTTTSDSKLIIINGGLTGNNSSKIISNGSLAVRGGGLNMSSSATIGFYGVNKDTIIGNVVLNNTTVTTVDSGVDLYIDGDVSSTSSADIVANGVVAINGNYQSWNSASVIGTGEFTATGSMNAGGSSSIYGVSPYSCSGPNCNANMPCGRAATLSTTTPEICSGSSVSFTAALTGNGTKTYLWQSSNTLNGTYSTASGNANSPTYSTTLTTARYFRVRITVSGCATFTNIVGVTINAVSTAPVNITATATSICAGSSTTLTAMGGSLGADATVAWYENNGCGGFTQNWLTQPYAAVRTTVNSASGVLNVTSAFDSWIEMYSLGSFNPNTYKYINIRYKVNSGNAGDVQLYFTNATYTAANENAVVVRSLVNDGTWQNLTIDMSVHPGWTSSNVTGWRYDFASGYADMEIDYISLTSTPAGNSNSTLYSTFSPEVTTTYSVRYEGLCNVTSCQQITVTVNAPATAVAGTDIAICGTASAVNITAGSSASNNNGTMWTSNGGGALANPNFLILATYKPNAADITAGSRTLTLTALGKGACPNVISTKTINMANPSTATSGGSQTICPSGTATVSGAGSGNGTITWTANGAGSLTNVNALSPVYTPASSDIGTTVTLTMTVSNGICANATASYSVVVSACILTWTGNTSAAWNTAGNWSPGTVPTSQHTVTIPAVASPKFKPLIASGINAAAAGVTVHSGATLTINSAGTLNAYGNVSNSGTFTAASGSTVAFRGTAAQTVSGVPVLYNTTLNNTAGLSVSSALSIKGTLLLTAGALTTNGNVQVDIDNGGNIGFTTGDAGSVIGNLKVFRAINTNTTHYISCPLDGVAGHDLADDAEVINPTNGNTRLFHYDNAAHSWIADKDMAAVFVPGNAYSMWFPVATTVDFTGSYNHSASYTYSGTNTANKYLFISNPYPSTIDWTAAGWSKSNVKDAIYFWNPNGNQYASYINGVGTNGGSKNIPAMNSFFVAYSGTGGSSSTVSMTNSVRVTQSAALWRTASDETVRLTLRSAAATDETVIRFNEHATNGFDDNFDAYKMMNSGSVPSIYTTSGTDRYSVNSIADMYSKDTIPVMIKVPADGEYVLSISSSDPTVWYMLVDKKLGTEHRVTTTDYSFTALKADDAARFELQVRSHVTTGVEQASALTSMHILSSPGGFLIRSGLSGSSTVEVLDMTGNRVQVMSGVVLKTGDNFFAPVVSAGVYVVKVTVDNMSYVAQVSIVK